MIFGNIANLEHDRKILPAAVIEGLQYLNDTDFSKLEVGKYEIEGNKIFALVQESQTLPKEDRRPEAHAKRLDIQYVIEGPEMIGFALPNAVNQVAEDLLEQKDNIFYATVQDEMDLVLTKGMYAIFFPDEVHRPNCQYGVSRKLRKVVVKIEADLL
jgi:biofilm protein TabA